MIRAGFEKHLCFEAKRLQGATCVDGGKASPGGDGCDGAAPPALALGPGRDFAPCTGVSVGDAPGPGWVLSAAICCHLLSEQAMACGEPREPH